MLRVFVFKNKTRICAKAGKTKISLACLFAWKTQTKTLVKVNRYDKNPGTS